MRSPLAETLRRRDRTELLQVPGMHAHRSEHGLAEGAGSLLADIHLASHRPEGAGAVDAKNQLDLVHVTVNNRPARGGAIRGKNRMRAFTSGPGGPLPLAPGFEENPNAVFLLRTDHPSV